MSDDFDERHRLAKEIEEALRRADLPHLYGYPWYTWAKEFFDSTNKNNLLCAANQISKSSTQIRKCIHWATETSLWPQLWTRKPNQFWYLYPSYKVLEAEFETKWKEFLPTGVMKDDPKYGWKESRKKGELEKVAFNSGVNVYFKVYSQKASDLQAGTVFALFADEEMPMDLYDELMNRMNATNGYFHMVFTATLGQDFWRRALEPSGREKEELPDAWKRQVSLYDSIKYSDGTPSQWTEERIGQVKARCKSHNEVLKRVFGKFILTHGRKVPEFDATRHMKASHPLPKNWLIYCGIDPGSGGEQGHPAAITYVAVKPDFRQARVFLGWRGDGIVTDNSAIVKKHIELKKEHNLQMTSQFYDWASKDFFIVASGMGENFIPAEKSHDIGEDIINTLFKNDMMFIYETDELAKLAGELSTLRSDEAKRHAFDNFYDSLRYAVTKVPWDFSGLTGKASVPVEQIEKPMSEMQRQLLERRKHFDGNQEAGWPSAQDEFDEWNEAYGSE